MLPLLRHVTGLLAMAVICFSCKQVFEYSPNEVRLPAGYRNLNAAAIARIQALPAKDTVSFILIGDSQRFYKELDDFVAHLNKTSGISFVTLAGDITDFGLQKEAIWVHDRLKRLQVPYVAVIGNHDMLANGRLLYREMYGPEDFSFNWAGIRFMGINTNSNEVGYSGQIPNLPWLEQQLTGAGENISHRVVISHMPPFDEGFDRKLEQGFARLLARQPGVRLSLHGHQHVSSRRQPYADGVEYITTASMNKRSYFLVNLFKGGYHVEERSF